MTSGVGCAVLARVSGLKTRALYGNGGVWAVRSRLLRTAQEGIFMRKNVPSMLITLPYSKILVGSRTLYLWTLKKSIVSIRMNHDGHPLNSGLQPAACSQRDTPCSGQRLAARGTRKCNRGFINSCSAVKVAPRHLAPRFSTESSSLASVGILAQASSQHNLSISRWAHIQHSAHGGTYYRVGCNDGR